MANPRLPTVETFTSEPLRHRFDDWFNPPGLTNFLGAAQVDHDVVAVRSVNYPPLSTGDTITGQLFVDGRLLRSLGPEVTVIWRPDRVTRRVRVLDLEIETETACPPGQTAVVVDIRIRNLGPQRRVTLGLAPAFGVTRSPTPWLRPEPPSETGHGVTVDHGRRALVATSPTTDAVCVQGVDVAVDRIDARLIELSTALGPGASWRFGFTYVLGESLGSALAAYDGLAPDVPAAVAAAEQLWARELAGVFDPESDSYSGSLPVLETSSDQLRSLYWFGILGVIWFRRDSPHSVLGRTYDTLMPRYWQSLTCIWDYSLSSTVHALLDPEPMRRQIEHWVGIDIHTHFGTEWVTGAPIGNWYSVSDSALTRLVRDRVRYTGDRAWLETPVATTRGSSRTMAEHVRTWATAWKDLRRSHALADYGEIDNLLECVSTYVHEVASLNASNVWCLRAAAELAELQGVDDEAAAFRRDADELVGHVLELYVPGGGYWHARQPDGELVPVRHCYDFFATGLALASDLSEQQRTEMVAFFERELRSETWMASLSPYDPDAAFSVRPDHQWNGAYPAWPAESARALVRLGRPDVATDWMRGLARSTNQGPFSQGHLVDGIVDAGHGGAPKGPPQPPYLMDWACSSSGAYVSLVIEELFGVDVSLAGEVRATPALDHIDPGARLLGLTIAGRTYDVDAAGIREVNPRPPITGQSGKPVTAMVAPCRRRRLRLEHR